MDALDRQCKGMRLLFELFNCDYSTFVDCVSEVELLFHTIHAQPDDNYLRRVNIFLLRKNFTTYRKSCCDK